MARLEKITLVGLLTLAASFGRLSADDETHTLDIDTYTVSGQTHTDDFNGVRVLITEVKEKATGKKVGGATVQIDHTDDNGTSVTVYTPSGIRVLVNPGKIPAAPEAPAAAAPAPAAAEPAK